MNFKSISLISSLGCNLKCEYCEQAQVFDYVKDLNLQQKNIQALQDGTFIQNVKTALKRLHADPLNIESVNLWGQENSIILKPFTSRIQEWFQLFPNWHNFMFSTNGQYYDSGYQDLLISCNNLSILPFQFYLQFSYDGYNYTENNRGAQIEKIEELISYLNTIVTDYKLDNINIYLVPHGVFSHQMLLDFDSMTNYDIENYIIKTNQQLNKLRSLITASNIKFYNDFLPYGLQFPYEYSSEDGKKLNCLLNRLSNLKNGQDMTTQLILANSMLKLDPDWINHYQNNVNNRFKLFCGNNNDHIKIQYDGQLINCTSHTFDLYKDHLPKDNSYKTIEKEILINHHYYHNVLTDTNRDLNIMLNFWDRINNDSIKMIYEQIKNNIKILSRYGLILSKYQFDEEAVNLHAYICLLFNCCFYNNLMLHGDLLIKNISYIQYFCNGFCDHIENYWRHYGQK